jgi:hypothetical protein
MAEGIRASCLSPSLQQTLSSWVITRTPGAMEVSIVLLPMKRHIKLKQPMHIWGWGGDETCYINSRLFFYSLA